MSNDRLFDIAYWGEHEYVITMSGHGPVGTTLSEKDANIVRRWLTGSYGELIEKTRPTAPAKGDAS